ncbi:hypothetical protein N5K55_05450 [Pseudomonas aeruginosa]|nr:hypothetical protein [Pseudomonas aeruginosa]
MTQLNPFIRGYESFRIERNLQITDEGDNLPCYRALHETQRHLPDEYFKCELCCFNDDFAVVAQELDNEIVEKCPHQGIVRNVLYSIYGEQDGRKSLSEINIH